MKKNYKKKSMKRKKLTKKNIYSMKKKHLKKFIFKGGAELRAKLAQQVALVQKMKKDKAPVEEVRAALNVLKATKAALETLPVALPAALPSTTRPKYKTMVQLEEEVPQWLDKGWRDLKDVRNCIKKAREKKWLEGTVKILNVDPEYWGDPNETMNWNQHKSSYDNDDYLDLLLAYHDWIKAKYYPDIETLSS